MDIHKSLDEFEFRSDATTDYRVTCSCHSASEKYSFFRFSWPFLFRFLMLAVKEELAYYFEC